MKSGVKGVCWDRVRRKWKVSVSIDGEKIYLGLFINLDNAIKKRKDTLVELDYIDKLPNKNELNIEVIREIFQYDKLSGILLWKINSAGIVKKGVEVGHIATTDGKSYRYVMMRGVTYRVHRIIFFYMKGYFPLEVDHIDGNGLNNKWNNLRSADDIINARNQRLSVRNKSGIPGVLWRKDRKSWYSTIGDKNIYLGAYKDFFEACCVRKSAEKKYGYHDNHGTIRPL